MKYDGVDVAAGGAETSHAIVAELVGSGRRVLDVGCSTGYLAQVLVQAGNRVSGVELDPEAAEKARPLLDQLVVG
ncbi:MAG TPA: methyltransferase domain-containing protein, partial [Acidimicrobiales bacterium]|nr:methyltransferase domain-containing protein [Acidimicrobiales bacterium]